ncbi:protein SFI1 homolog isoform X2 [Cyprinodon tularosa]|nr:protein SFI1 homolog isoform X2 [Cyprinodon tularosa]
MEHRADVWFAVRCLPRCFNSWVEFTLQRQMQRQRRFKAETFNQQRQLHWVFSTWRGRSEKQKEESLSERIAVLHEERCCLQRAWRLWRLRTHQRIREVENQEALHCQNIHRLLHNTLMQRRDYSSEISDRRTRELQAGLQGDLHCVRRAVDKWKKFVQKQRLKKSRLKEIQDRHEAKLLKHSFVAWENHGFEMSLMWQRAKKLHQQQTERFLRRALIVWRERAELLAEVRLAEQKVQRSIQQKSVEPAKAFYAWRGVTTGAILKLTQQRELLSWAPMMRSEAQLLLVFRQWRKRTTVVRQQRMKLEKAKRHHSSKLLSKTLHAWSAHHCQLQRNKVMKRQGLLLLKLKMYQKFFEQWKTKLQHRRRENNQTEQALWHWSLTLQAKVLQGWRLWVKEQRSEREHAGKAAQVYRDQLLKAGVTCILTYAAHMNDLTASLTELSQEQRSQRLQRIVKRCAVRWKEQALRKPPKEQEVRAQPIKKSVTFCLPGLGSISTSDSPKQEEEAFSCREVSLSSTEAAYKAPNPPAVSCLHHDKDPADSSCQKSFMFAAEPLLETTSQDQLLPPSAFMTSSTQKSLTGSGLLEAPVVSHHEFVSASQHVSSDFKDLSSKNPPDKDAAALMRELLSIQTNMEQFQQSRKQLRAWRKLRDVLDSWLQMSAEDEQVEKRAVCEELQELEKHIQELSTELDKQKPTILLHVERIQYLQSVLHSSGVYPLH